MKEIHEITVQEPRFSMDELRGKLTALRSRIKELEEHKIKISLKIVMTEGSIEELKKKKEEINNEVFESLMTEYVSKLHDHKNEEKQLKEKIGSLKSQLNLFEEYKPLLKNFEDKKNEMKEIHKKIRELEKKLNYG